MHSCQMVYHCVSSEDHKSCSAAIASFTNFTCAPLRC